MADNATGDLREAQQAIKAMMAPLEDTASSEDAPGDMPEGETEMEAAEAVEVEEEPTAEAEDSGDEEYEEPGEPLHTVKVRGEDVKVTYEELVNGYSRQADYTRKVQELAEQRKAVQTLEQEIAAERDQYAQLLPAMRQQLEQQLQAEPDWDKLYDQNPIEATKLERKWREAKDQREAQIRAVEQEQQRMAQIRQRQLQEQQSAQVKAEQERLPTLIPEWKNADTAQREAAEIRQFLLGKGFAEADVDAITHAGVVALARNAMLFERGQKKISQAKSERKQTGPKQMKAGSKGTQPRKRSSVEKAQQRLRQTGRVADAAAVIKSLL